MSGCFSHEARWWLWSRGIFVYSFDPFFTVNYSSTLKVITIRSDFGWIAHILPYISKYFWPCILLLKGLQEQLIISIKLQENKVHANPQFTHNNSIDGIVKVLSKLPQRTTRSWRNQMKVLVLCHKMLGPQVHTTIHLIHLLPCLVTPCYIYLQFRFQPHPLPLAPNIALKPRAELLKWQSNVLGLVRPLTRQVHQDQIH